MNPHHRTVLDADVGHQLFKYDVHIRCMDFVWNDYENGEISAREDKSVSSEKINLADRLMETILVGTYIYDSKHLLYTFGPMEQDQSQFLRSLNNRDFIVDIQFNSCPRVGELSYEDYIMFKELLIGQVFKNRWGFEPLQKSFLFMPEANCYEDMESTGVVLRLGFKKRVEWIQNDLNNSSNGSDSFRGAVVVRDIKQEPTFAGSYSLFDHANKCARLYAEQEIQQIFKGVCFRVAFDPKQRIKFARFSDGPIGTIPLGDYGGTVAQYFFQKFGVLVDPCFKAMVTECSQFYPIEHVYPVEGQFVPPIVRESVLDWKDFHIHHVDKKRQFELWFHDFLRQPEQQAFFKLFGVRYVDTEELTSVSRTRYSSGISSIGTLPITGPSSPNYGDDTAFCSAGSGSPDSGTSTHTYTHTKEDGVQPLSN